MLSKDEPVEVRIIFLSFYERRAASHHHKQNDGRCEKVDINAFILKPVNDFGCLVARCAQLRGQACWIEASGKTKVDNLEVAAAIDHQVLGLEVPMANAGFVAVL